MSDADNVLGCGCLAFFVAPFAAFFASAMAYAGWHFAKWLFS